MPNSAYKINIYIYIDSYLYYIYIYKSTYIWHLNFFKQNDVCHVVLHDVQLQTLVQALPVAKL